MKPIDLVVGSIRELDTDRLAGWNAYFKADAEIKRLRAAIKRLRKRLSSKS
jgi:hypothetical protein